MSDQLIHRAVTGHGSPAAGSHSEQLRRAGSELWKGSQGPASPAAIGEDGWTWIETYEVLLFSGWLWILRLGLTSGNCQPQTQPSIYVFGSILVDPQVAKYQNPVLHAEIFFLAPSWWGRRWIYPLTSQKQRGRMQKADPLLKLVNAGWGFRRVGEWFQ